uniref:Uncharacterized protein n=1 Tax=Raphanus sativus TaxID=3726 RepID=A0A650GC13_RAPSA|nr:hypothetical protein [Raphanus sativus]
MKFFLYLSRYFSTSSTTRFLKKSSFAFLLSFLLFLEEEEEEEAGAREGFSIMWMTERGGNSIKREPRSMIRKPKSEVGQNSELAA